MGDKLANTLIVFIMVVILGLGGIYYTKVVDSQNYTVQNGTTYSQMLQEDGHTNVEDNNQEIDNINSNYTLGTKEYMQMHNNRYYYNYLDEGAKAIYDAIVNNIENLKTENYTINIDYDFKKIFNNGLSKELLNSYYEDAINAISLDVPYLFYLDFSKMTISVETKTNIFGTKYNAYITPGKNKNYLMDQFESSAQVDVALSQLEMVKKQVKTTLNGIDYNKLYLLHDWLVEYMEYDSSSANKASIYGGLIEKKGVCESYARIFKTILDEIGIENILVTGTATNSKQSTEDHMWNDVKINGKWYGVDVTWDDPIVIGGGTVSNEVKHRYFLKGSQDFYKNHTEKLTISKTSKVFPLPTLEVNNY